VRLTVGIENVADRDSADRQRDAIDVTLPSQLIGAVLDDFLLAAETECLPEEVTLRTNFRESCARLLCFAIGESGKPESAGKAISLRQLRIEIDFTALPQPPPDKGRGGPGLAPLAFAREAMSDQLEPEDGVLWIYDLDGIETLAFTDFGIENLREIIRDQIDRPK
jgi:hypothetical protein